MPILNALSKAPDTPIISRFGVKIVKKPHYLQLLAKHDDWAYVPIKCDLSRAPAVLGKDVHIFRPAVGNSDLFSAFWLDRIKALYNLSLPVQTPSLSTNRAVTHP